MVGRGGLYEDSDEIVRGSRAFPGCPPAARLLERVGQIRLLGGVGLRNLEDVRSGRLGSKYGAQDISVDPLGASAL
jgi:hypothetical protein